MQQKEEQKLFPLPKFQVKTWRTFSLNHSFEYDQVILNSVSLNLNFFLDYFQIYNQLYFRLTFAN